MDFHKLSSISNVAVGLASEITSFDGFVVHGVHKSDIISLRCAYYHFPSTQRIYKLYVQTDDTISYIAYLQRLS